MSLSTAKHQQILENPFSPQMKLEPNFSFELEAVESLNIFYGELLSEVFLEDEDLYHRFRQLKSFYYDAELLRELHFDPDKAEDVVKRHTKQLVKEYKKIVK